MTPPRLVKNAAGRIVFNSPVLAPLSVPFISALTPLSPVPALAPASPVVTPVAPPVIAPIISMPPPAPPVALRRSSRVTTVPSRFALMTATPVGTIRRAPSGRLVQSVSIANSQQQSRLCKNLDGRIVVSLPPSVPVVIDLVTPPSSPDESFTVVSRQRHHGVVVKPSSYQVVRPPLVQSCGDGLFATQHFPANSRVSKFIGEYQ